jgi:hypothetical protein
MTPDEEQMIQLYGDALDFLVNENPAWSPNWRKYENWGNDLRIWYCKQIQKQAARGVPMAMELHSTALAIRMTR